MKKSVILLKKKLKLKPPELVKLLVDLEYKYGTDFIKLAKKQGVRESDITPGILHSAEAAKKERHRKNANSHNELMEKGKAPFWYVIENDHEFDPSLNPEFAKRIYESKYTAPHVRERMLALMHNAALGSEKQAKPLEKTPKPANGPGIVVQEGKQYKIFGYSVRRILHWMYQDDWELDEVKEVMEKLNIEMAESSLKVGLSEGNNKKRADPAPLNKEQRKKIYSLLS